MSAWLLLVRDLHAAGGVMRSNRNCWGEGAAKEAQRRGLLARGVPGASKTAVMVITPLGKLAAEGRVTFKARSWAGETRTGGRPLGSVTRPVATWLAPLPRSNEVRLTGLVQRAQDDGTCYW